MRWLLSQTQVKKVLDILLYSSAVLSDKTAAHALTENPVASSRSKHIAIKYGYVRHLGLYKLIYLGHVDTKSNNADLMSNPVAIEANDNITPQKLGHEPFIEIGTRELTRSVCYTAEA